KTGTLTEGKPKLTDIVTAGVLTDDQLLILAASLEKGSEHPLAEAIVEGAKARTLTLLKAETFEAVTGKGVSGGIGGQSVALGNKTMMQDAGADISALSGKADALRIGG
ncbi:HAD family hydrolase, partial [Escherichia coli]|nr:HAD family hydrolase [Escherichia coli]